MKCKNLKTRFGAFLVAASLLATSVTVNAAPQEQPQFGDILYSDDGVTVFYGNPYKNKEEAQKIEEAVARGPAYSQQWIDANTSADKRISIPASSSYPLTYYTIKQETTSFVKRSYVYVYRPDGSVGFIWEMDSGTQEIRDRVIGSRTLPNSPVTYTSGSLELRWDVETGDSGARMNLWAW